jgi:hypothetical protein
VEHLLDRIRALEAELETLKHPAREREEQA